MTIRFVRFPPLASWTFSLPGTSAPLALALAFLATACGGHDCQSLCEDMVDENCWEGDGPEKDDCEDLCDKDAELMKRSDCQDQYDDLIECSTELDDVCDVTPRSECTTTISEGNVETRCMSVAPKACANEWNRMRSCLQAYCAGHPDQCS